MKTNKISFLVNMVVICVLLFSGMFIPGQGGSSVQAQTSNEQMVAPLVTFEGLPRSDSDPAFTIDSDLPDTSGAVGPTLYIQAVNEAVRIFDKMGNPLATSTFEDFWTGQAAGTACEGGLGNHHGQPTVLYDHVGHRWFIADLAYTNVDLGPYYFCIAVSNNVVKDGSDPAHPMDFTGQTPVELPGVTPTGSWWFYTLRAQESWPYYLPNQPKFGLWGDGYYIAFDQNDVENNGKNITPKGSRVWAINRDDLNNGTLFYRARSSYLPEELNYHGLIPATLLGDPAAVGTPEFFGAIAPPNRLYLFRFQVNWISPDQSVFNQTPTTLYMNTPYTGAVGYLVPQAGTTEKLDIIGDRLTSLKYRQVTQCADTSVYCADVLPSLWAAHTAMSGSAGALRWYEVRNPNTNPSLYQEGIYAPNSATRWVGDLAIDAEGDMAIGYSVSSSGMYPSIRYTGRRSTDPLNTLFSGEAALVDETLTTYQDHLNNLNDGVWGRHSSMSVDPVDQCVFWYTNQYYNELDANPNIAWHTRIGWFRFPSCGGGTLTRVSLSTENVQGNGSSGIDFEAYTSAVSSTGRYVAFASEATNLVSGDTNGKWDAFLRDRDVDGDGIFDEPGQVRTTRLSNGQSGTQANGDSWQVSISADGRYIAFSSKADNLVAGDTNGTQDVFRYDRNDGSIMRISVNTTGEQGYGQSDQPAISGNGRYIAFHSYAPNLVSGDINSLGDVFVRDTYAGQTTRVSVATAGAEAHGESYSPAINYDGRYVAFASRAVDLVANDVNLLADVFIRDRSLGNTVLASVATTGSSPADANGESYDPSITSNATQVFVAFVSRSTTLTAAGTNGAGHIFVRTLDLNLTTGTTIHVSNSYIGAQGNLNSFAPAISQDGRYVAYASDASNLDLQPDTNGVTDIYLKDLVIGLTQRMSVGLDGLPSNGPSKDPAISADGQQVVFTSNATNLVTNDTNNVWDVFAFDKRGGTPNFLTIPSNLLGVPGAAVSVPVNFTPNGQQIDAISFSVDFDQTCLTFVDAAGAVVFNVGAGFNPQYSYSAADTDGEIDLWITPTGSPAPVLQPGALVTIQLTVKASCQATPGTTRTARVGFSKDPQASFGRNGASIAARTTDGSISVLSGVQGDCNSDGLLNAGDISALVNEIFDGDGNLPYDAPKGTFAGSPVGCNPNTDVVIDAGDISCMAQLLFGNACSGATVLNSMSSMAGSTDPLVSLVGPATVVKGQPVSVPVKYSANGHTVNSLVFSMSYDPTKMAFDPTDANQDDIPDALHLTLPSGFNAFVALQPTQASDQIGVVVLNLNNASAALPDGNLGEMAFRVPANAVLGETQVSIGANPPISFGEGGKSVMGSYENYSMNIIDAFRVYIPSASQPDK